MNELAVSVGVFTIIALIYWRYESVFCLPFFWAAEFAFLYLGLLQIHAQFGGSSYIYAAIGFAVYYLGLRAVDLFDFHRASSDRRQGKSHASCSTERQQASNSTRKHQPVSINLLFPSLPLKVGLFVSIAGATVVSFIFFAQNGIPILSSFPAMAWIQATSGIVNRLMTVFGPGCFASLALVAWGIHRKSGSRAALALMYVGLGLAILTQALLASKAAAIMVFIWFNIMLFYLDKKRDFRKSVLPLILVVVPVSAAIVAVRLMSSQGYWEAGSIYQTYYQRLTTTSAEPMDFVFKYMDRFGPMHGRALRREVGRIREQLTGGTKTPILSEFVYDLMAYQSTNETGLSASLTLGGTGYVEWGFIGLLLYSFVQGLGFGWIHRYLVHQEKMNIIVLVFWGAIVNYLLAVSGSGTILVGLESVVLSVLPPLIFLFPFCFLFLLPLAKKYGAFPHRGISSIAKGERRWIRN